MAPLQDADDILHGLNTAQRAAVASPASVLQILAPPGSGKTKTLTARVAYLLRHHGYRPENMIVATFTVKAAREMRERLSKLLGDGTEKKLLLGTFHSIARRLLVRYGQLIGLRPNFGIADSSDSMTIIRRIIKKNKFHIKEYTARNRISSLKAKGKREVDPPTGHSKVEAQEFAQVFAEYQSALEISNLLDYDDLLVRCTELLQQHPHCVRYTEAVLIDEFQDTNIVQFELMTLFASARKRVTIVGDPDQSIYGFRHAEIKNLERMHATYRDVTVIMLEENYRSSGGILKAALEVIEQDTSRPQKALLPTHCAGIMPVLRPHQSADDEAYWLVSEIKRSTTMTGNVLTLNDYAILLRSAYLSRSIELALGKSGISYKMVGGNKFFDRLEVKIVIDYLRVISQPDNNDALARIINVPPRRIGETTVKNLLEEAEEKKVTLWSLVTGHATPGAVRTKVTKIAGNKMTAFVQLIKDAKQKLMTSTNKQSPITDLVEHILSAIAFEDHLKKAHQEDHEARWGNVQELVAQTREFSAVREYLSDDDGAGSENEMENELAKFLANLALSSEITTGAEKDGQQTQQVTISTIHAAKGLEWPVVFVPGAYQGSIPHSRAEDQDEERRLLYVAMTRAQALLYISYPEQVGYSGESVPVSNFLDTKPLKRLLIKEDPPFEYETVQSICNILRRACPSEEEIEEMFQQHEKKGSVAPRGPSHARKAEPEGSKAKRPKTQHVGISANPRQTPSGFIIPPYSTTMQDPSAFSIASTSMNAGFVSAGTHFQNMCQAGSGSLQGIPYSTGYAGYSAKPKGGSPHEDLARGSPAHAPSRQDDRELLRPISTNQAPGSGRMTFAAPSGPLKRAREPSKPYAFLSSSPAKSVGTDSAEKRVDQAAAVEPSTDATTMQAAGYPKAPARKTLGVRRGMKSGWTPPAARK